MSSLQGLMARVERGDNAAAGELGRLLRPVVSRAVWRILQGAADPSPLGERVRGLMAEVGDTAANADPEWTASAITQTLCQQAVARARHGTAALSAAETIRA